MTRGTLFWVLWLLSAISLVAGTFWWPTYSYWNMVVVSLILFGLVGWKLWGGPVKAD